jgi:hypothetical protein
VTNLAAGDSRRGAGGLRQPGTRAGGFVGRRGRCLEHSPPTAMHTGEAMKFTALMGLVVLGLAACTGAVKMQHPATGKVVACGPYSADTNAPWRESQCIQDYKEQGYVRVP